LRCKVDFAAGRVAPRSRHRTFTARLVTSGCNSSPGRRHLRSPPKPTARCADDLRCSAPADRLYSSYSCASRSPAPPLATVLKAP